MSNFDAYPWSRPLGDGISIAVVPLLFDRARVILGDEDSVHVGW